MSRETVNYVVEKTRELMAAPTCSAETKASAQAWLDSIGTDREAAQTQKYIAELEADIMPIDNLIGFAESEAGAKVFGGAEAAGQVAAHARGEVLRLPGLCGSGRNPGKERRPAPVKQSVPEDTGASIQWDGCPFLSPF